MPTHPFIFIAVAFVLIATIIRRPDLSTVAMPGFFAHLGVDTGIFPPFSPLSFAYDGLGDYQLEFLSVAVATAIAAGFMGRRRIR